ncbi:basic secretory protein-like protein [Arcticibacter eurypsychrophilus]|uniref:basic secretory protein-like protein n=1 Tax=Arcticibacter eurypsychrophilus TaxID=1434752 RepID=UPI00084DF6F2|nr:basic secretory protein-like protein [Arcticibacter eurypsychrophilus]
MFKVNLIKNCVLIALVSLGNTSFAQKSWETIDSAATVSSDTIKKGKNILVFINQSKSFSVEVKDRLIDVFFKVYPKEVKTYNKSSIRKVIFIIDPGYDGVAATSGDIVRFNPEWFRKNPGDVDVVTHEVMHIVQSYPGGAGPGWITEGIADYVRLTMGVDNKGANWKVPEYTDKQSYTDAYRVTARFLYWLEKNKDKGLVKKLDHAMRSKKYTEDFWVKNTGKTVDQLWDEYSKKPAIG